MQLKVAQGDVMTDTRFRPTKMGPKKSDFGWTFSVFVGDFGTSKTD
jgi:hypothetical protein